MDSDSEPFGTLRHVAAKVDSTGYVRSAGEQRSGLSEPARAHYGDRLSSDEPRPLPSLNATSELDLLEGRGICGRCGGSGQVARDELRPMVRSDCPRCLGSGRKARSS